MVNFKEKIIYCLVLLVFLILGASFGYIQTREQSSINVENMSLLDYAKNYEFKFDNDGTLVSASTKTYDIEVVYEDSYSVCNENILNTKTLYGTTMDKVKEDEKKYQEEKGLVYEIKGESAEKIIYTRTINANCPNHFLVIKEEKNINIYSIQAENKKILYMTLDNINTNNLRDELKIKVEKGTYINSKEELNTFIEDLES